MNVDYFRYLLGKPFHSQRHKALKNRSSALARDSNLYKKAMEEISEYTKEDFPVIEDNYKNFEKLICNDRDYDSMDEAELMKFYAKDTSYIYELPLWNASCGRSFYLTTLLAPYLLRQGYKNILDFGGGAGDLCIALKEAGFNVYYYDVNKPLTDFAKWRFNRRKLDIEAVDPGKSGRLFDCVISFDVFEHFKDLPAKLKSMNGFVKEKGGLIFNIELSGDGLHLKENKIYNDERVLDKALSRAYFAFHWKFKKFFFYKKISNLA